MAERMQATVPVFLFLINEHDEVYLQRRYRTGYMDGYWEPPAGKTDKREFPPIAACREAREEAGVDVDPKSVGLFHTYMNVSNGSEWLGLMFRTRQWDGEPTIQESNKCDAADFFALDALPEVTPQVRDALGRILTAASIDMSWYDDLPA